MEQTAKKSWLSNKSFRGRAIVVLAMTFAFMYFSTCCTMDSYNVLQIYLPSLYGFTTAQLAIGKTISGILGIPAGFLIGWLIQKFGPSKISGICAIIMGLGEILMATVPVFIIYTVSLILVGCVASGFTYGMAVFTSNWFIEYRGRALGINTMGAPLQTATSLTLLTMGCNALGFKFTFWILGGLVILLGILTLTIMKDTPEECGLQPDGIERSEEEKERMRRDMEATSGGWTPKKIFTYKESWLQIIGQFTINFAMCCMMMFFVPRFLAGGVYTQPQVISAFSIGGLCAIPMSYFYGWLDDKIDTRFANAILAITQLIALIALIFGDKSIVFLYLAGFGIASMSGGLPNLNPSISAHTFGRAHFMFCHKYVSLITGIGNSFAATFMAAFAAIAVSKGLPELNGYINAYWVLAALCVVSVICHFCMSPKSYDDKLLAGEPLPTDE